MEGVCVVVVDVQEEFTQIHEVISTFPAFQGRVQYLLQSARSHGCPVVHIRAEYDKQVSPWVPWFFEISGRTYHPTLPTAVQWAKETEEEEVVIKHTFDGFLGTNLEECLRKKGVRKVFICGLLTSACVLATTIGAFFRGFHTFLVSDCCADRTLEKHESVLKLYENYYFRLVDSEGFSLFLDGEHLRDNPKE